MLALALHARGKVLEDPHGSDLEPSRVVAERHLSAMLAATWALYAISVVAFAVRSWVRAHVMREFRLDDWLMLCALLANTVFHVFITRAMVNAVHDPYDYAWLQSHVLCIFPAVLADAFARVSSALLLGRIFSTVRWFRWYLTVFSVLLVSFAVGFIITFYASVRPLSALWSPGAPNPQVIIPPKVYLIMLNAGCSLIALIDLTYIFIPIFLSWSFPMSRARRISLLGVAIVSLAVVAACLLKLIEFHKGGLNLTTNQWAYLCSAVEQGLGVTLGCIPPLLVLLKCDCALLRAAKRAIIKMCGDRSERARGCGGSNVLGRSSHTITGNRPWSGRLSRTESGAELSAAKQELDLSVFRTREDSSQEDMRPVHTEPGHYV